MEVVAESVDAPPSVNGGDGSRGDGRPVKVRFGKRASNDDFMLW